MNEQKSVVFLTAGAAGMFCGSCMHDNSLAKALRRAGVDCLLQPLYTPIRTDESAIVSSRVFFGGIHVYLLQHMPWLRFVPKPLRRMLDWPPLIRLATRRIGATDPAKLGELSVSMLQGADGRQAEEVSRLVNWLADDIRPSAIILSNLLIGGAIPAIRAALPDTKIIVLLQGDDIFLDHLPDQHRDRAIALCHQLSSDVDHFVVNSQFYHDKMSTMLSIDVDKFKIMPLSIDIAPYSPESEAAESPTSESVAFGCESRAFRLGYLARIAPEKGLHRLVDAFIELAGDRRHDDLTLHVAGWLGAANEPYFDDLKQRIVDAGLEGRFQYHGSPELDQKAAFLSSLDLLSVPTEYEDPKGLFVLEANASGVPVVQPDHGAFGELVSSTGGGIVVPANQHDALVSAIRGLIGDPARRSQLGTDGRHAVSTTHTISRAAEQMRRLIDS